jgi:nicotinate-nucleotide adenylyltransferase
LIAPRSEALRSPAYFGGTFDPPHLGHREAALGLLKNPGVSEVVLLPCGVPPLKTQVTEAHHRVRMLELLFENALASNLRVDAREIARAMRSPFAPTTTFETLIELKQERGAPVAMVIGTDQLADLPRWSRFPELLGLAHWWVLKRKDDPSAWTKTLRELQAQGGLKSHSDDLWSTSAGTRIELVSTFAPPLSSTGIREQIARTGIPPDESLPPQLQEYIQNQGLYGLVAKC